MLSHEPSSHHENESEMSASSRRDICYKYSNRVLIKHILENQDNELGMVGMKLIIGGWVKSSKEVQVESQTTDKPVDAHATSKPVDMNCMEMLQSRFSFFKSICTILGGAVSSYQPSDGHQANVQRSEPPYIVYLVVNDGSCTSSLQVLVNSSIVSPSQLLPTGSCILAEGVLQQSTIEGKHSVELKVEKVLHVGASDPDKYPLSKKRLPLENLREFSHFRPRTTTVASVMRIRNAVVFGTHMFFQKHDFLCVQMPIITTMYTGEISENFLVTTVLDSSSTKGEFNYTNQQEIVALDAVKATINEKVDVVEQLKRSESNKEAYVAALQDLQKTKKLASHLEAKHRLNKENSTNFFPKETYLTKTGRLHLESHACALGNVYTLGPTFHASRESSATQMAERWTAEVEIAFSKLEDAMNCAEDLLKFVSNWVLENCSKDVEFVSKRADKAIIDLLSTFVSTSCDRITYQEALDGVQKFGLSVPGETIRDLKAEHLRLLADEIYKKPVIIYNFPREQKPFFVRQNDGGKTVAAFEMIAPNIGTIIAGCQTEERVDQLDARMKENEVARGEYEWYMDLRRHGTVSHCGFTFMVDLMVLLASALSDVKDTVPFHRSFGEVAF